MDANFKRKVDFDSPGTYRIRVEGHIGEQMADLLGGMIITRAFTSDKRPMTILVGQLRDQAALAGVLNELYEMHRTLITVESLPQEKSGQQHCSP